MFLLQKLPFQNLLYCIHYDSFIAIEQLLFLLSFINISGLRLLHWYIAEDGFTGGIRMSECHISMPKQFATGVSERFTRYEICSTANSWNDDQKALKLPILLEGEAIA